MSKADLKQVIATVGFFPQPPADALAAAEVVDMWSVLARSDSASAYALRGMAQNGSFVQHAIDAIDGSAGGPRWIASAGMYFKLGWPNDDMHPIVEVATCDDWPTAFRLATDRTGRHTLDEASAAAVLAAEAEGDADWFARRTSCRALCAMLQERGRRAVADAWRLLGGDPALPAEAELVSGLLRASGECSAPVLSDVLGAWEDAARGEAALVGDGDHIALGARFMADGRPRSRLEPLLLRAIRCRSWHDAASAVLQECPYQIQLKARLDGFGEVLPSQRAGIAELFAKDLAEAHEPDIAECFRLLAVDPFDVADMQWVVDRLLSMLPFVRSTADEALVAGWQKLAASDRSGIDVGRVDDRDAIAMAWAASAARTAAEVEGRPCGLSDLKDQDADGAETGPLDDHEGVIVLSEIGGVRDTASYRDVSRAFRDVVGKRLPLTRVHDLDLRRGELVREFPHAERAVSAILSDLRGRRFVRFRPTVLVGPPGTGKSRLVRRIGEVFSLETARFDASGAADNTFGGCPRHWHNGEPSFPVLSLIARGRADGIVMIDELDKGATARLNGNIAFALLPMLEVETAKRHADPYLQAPVDLSNISFFATVNEVTELPTAVRDRFRVVRVEAADAEHMLALARSMIADAAEASGEDSNFFPNLDDGEAAIVEALWPGGSLRRLRDIVELILRRRETHPRQ